MKKPLIAILALCLICASAAGCTDKGAALAENGASAPTGSEAQPAIDVDLTELGYTMAYGVLNDILSNPDGYLGKSIKMQGLYASSYFAATGQYYHFVVIDDVTNCCQQGLEFLWDGDHAYPDDYPEQKDTIEVRGVIGKYDELGKTYYYLAVDELSIAE